MAGRKTNGGSSRVSRARAYDKERMPDYVLLLRGVNLGGHRRVAMADLRRVLEGLGYAEVSTWLQSGNALFSADRASGADEERLCLDIERALTRELGLTVPCVLRSRAELRRVIECNPLAEIAHNPARLLVTFLLRPPDAAALAAVDPTTYAPIVLAPGEREVYGWYPQGVGRSPLTQAFFERRLGGMVATARNWNTVTGLLERMSR